MSKSISEAVRAGQAFYSKRNLRIYDLGVLGLSNSWIWRCPTQQLLNHFNQFVSANHLDIGVGSGFYLDRCRFPSPNPRLALMDLNPQALDYAALRNRRYQPKKYVRNVLEPISWEEEKFDSVSLNYLLHCVPGSIESKAVIFDHVLELMHPGAVCFGSTLLQHGVHRNWAAQRLMGFYNQKGIFANTADSLEGFEREFFSRFKRPTLKTIGCAVVFAGYKA